ncbi:hypothetical protein TNCT_385151 [Trichonephila clavata]|uniref:Uncharacterized protein n=1 Tax=Trichonephila clavata TaxID=2740835 RepID=A0A8X6L4S0_TRICU|nr:hypothetical protein TNCT_385151 [Trichonephila clavata]
MGISTASCIEMSRVKGSGPLQQSSQDARVCASKPWKMASAGCTLKKCFATGNPSTAVGFGKFQQIRRGISPRQGDR